MIAAYKIWYDTKHYIHKDTTDQLNVSWTTNIEDAKSFFKYSDASNFFHDVLGFSYNHDKYDALKFTN